MNLEMVIDYLNQTLLTVLLLLTPIMATMLGIGIAVSLIQSVTSIQEQTLTFVPKLIGLGVVIAISAHWMLRTMIEFSVLFISKIASMGPN